MAFAFSLAAVAAPASNQPDLRRPSDRLGPGGSWDGTR